MARRHQQRPRIDIVVRNVVILLTALLLCLLFYSFLQFWGCLLILGIVLVLLSKNSGCSPKN